MIKLNKTAEPEILINEGPAWLKIIQDKLENGEVPTEAEKGKYRHKDIKSALVEETHGKCAYCESYLRHIAFGDIEHIHPKSAKLEDLFRWANLTLACDICNTAKSNHNNVVDPYTDEPAQHFKFFGPMIYANTDSAKAVFTAKKLKLNRDELIARRAQRLSAISDILLLISQATNNDIRQVLIEDLFENEISDSSEYAAFTRSFLREVNKDLGLTADNDIA